MYKDSIHECTTMSSRFRFVIFNGFERKNNPYTDTLICFPRCKPARTGHPGLGGYYVLKSSREHVRIHRHQPRIPRSDPRRACMWPAILTTFTCGLINNDCRKHTFFVDVSVYPLHHDNFWLWSSSLEMPWRSACQMTCCAVAVERRHPPRGGTSTDASDTCSRTLHTVRAKDENEDSHMIHETKDLDPSKSSENRRE